ncbi:maestro heat-like repeat-containing protein family member 2B [Tachyglossus aculeatus]|uniref:maestro heat-like repeat-containing protein family member 2B n=1 Tax=Tachyglossus aculeatus TaxID=9261 RepID=UPI0018F32E65|nr:maestro heat-like repeat-containing protein family member 2B [Tachyglossus aculeatus]
MDPDCLLEESLDFSSDVDLILNTLDTEDSEDLNKECIYNCFIAILHGDYPLDDTVIQRMIFHASKDMHDSTLPRETRMLSGDVLVSLARHNFNCVMYELQKHFRVLELPDEFTVLALADLASTYVSQSIPFMTLILVTLQTMLRLADDEKMRGAFCIALEKFSKAIEEYIKKWQEFPYPRMDINRFLDKIFMIFCHIMDNWVPRAASPVTSLAVIKAYGPSISLLLHREELREFSLSQVPWLLAQYKDTETDFFVSQSLKQILAAAADYGICLPKTIRQPIFTELHSRICKPPLPRIEENEMEAACCFLFLARSNTADLLEFYDDVMRSSHEAVRVGTLALLRSAVCINEPKMRNYVVLVEKTVKSTLGDPRNRVRLNTLLLIKSMCELGFLEASEGWPLLDYVFAQYVLSNARLKAPKAVPAEEAQEETAVLGASLEVLQTLNPLIGALPQILWPRLLTFVVPAEYTGVLASTCKILRLLVAAKKEEEAQKPETSSALAGHGTPGQLPSPHQLLARLLVTSVLACEGEERGTEALQLLQAIPHLIHLDLVKPWTTGFPVPPLPSAGNSQERVRWETSLLQFLTETLYSINDNVWTSKLSLELSQQMNSYARTSAEQKFLWKALGTTLACCQDENFVGAQLRDILRSANRLGEPRQGTSYILGHCAASHLDLVLKALKAYEEGETSFLSRCKGLFSGKKNLTKLDLMAIYGSVALHAPKQELLARVDLDIAAHVLHLYNACCQVLGITVVNKDVDLQIIFTRSVTEMTVAVQEAAANLDYKFSHKEALLGHMLDFIREEPLDSLASPIRWKALIAIRHLSTLKPRLSLNDKLNILNESLKSLLPLPPMDQLIGEGQTDMDKEHIEFLYVRSLDALRRLLKTMLWDGEDPEECQEIFNLLRIWHVSPKEWERERILQLSAEVLASNNQRPANFRIGSLVGLFGPHCCDSLPTIRQGAADAIICLLGIQGMPQELGKLQDLREELCSLDCQDQFQISTNIAKIVSKFIPHEETQDFLEELLDGLENLTPSCAKACSIWMVTILEEQGAMLEGQLLGILESIYHHMTVLRLKEQSFQFVLQIISLIASFHLESVVSSLLAKPLPFDRDTRILWQALAGETHSTPRLLRVLMDRLNQGMEDDVAETEAIAAACALREVVEAGGELGQLFPELFQLLLKLISCTQGRETLVPALSRRRVLQHGERHQGGNPCSLSTAALRCVQVQAMKEGLAKETEEGENLWSLLSDPHSHPTGVCVLARSLPTWQQGITLELMARLRPALSSPSESYRVTGTTFFSELLKEPTLWKPGKLKEVLFVMAQTTWDPNLTLRQMAIRGLGNATTGAPNKVRKNKQLILDAVIRGLYHLVRTDVICESLKALRSLLGLLSAEEVNSHFQEIVLLTRTFLEDEQDEVRLNSIQLFGILAEKATSSKRPFFKGEMKKTLTAFFLHLWDPNPQIGLACRTTISACLPYLGMKELGGIVDKHLATLEMPKARDFYQDACGILARKNAALLQTVYMHTCSFFQSPWERIRCAAAKLADAIIQNAPGTPSQWLDQESLDACLRGLKTDPCVSVQRAAEAARHSLLRRRAVSGSSLPHP